MRVLVQQNKASTMKKCSITGKINVEVSLCFVTDSSSLRATVASTVP